MLSIYEMTDRLNKLLQRVGQPYRVRIEQVGDYYVPYREPGAVLLSRPLSQGDMSKWLKRSIRDQYVILTE